MIKTFERIFTSETSSRFENNLWTLTVSMSEKARLTPDSPWVEKVISCTETDEKFQVAYGKAMDSVLEQFNDILRTNNSSGLLSKEFYSEEETSPVEEPSRVLSASDLE